MGGVYIFYLVKPRVRTRLPDGRNVRRTGKNNSLQPVKVGGIFSFADRFWGRQLDFEDSTPEWPQRPTYG